MLVAMNEIFIRLAYELKGNLSRIAALSWLLFKREQRLIGGGGINSPRNSL